MHFLVNGVKYKSRNDLINSEVDYDKNTIYLVCNQKHIDSNIFKLRVPIILIYYYNVINNSNKFIDDKILMSCNFIIKYTKNHGFISKYGGCIDICEYDYRDLWYIESSYVIKKTITYYLIKSIDCEIIIDDDVDYKKYEFSGAILLIIKACNTTKSFKICGNVRSRNRIEIIRYYQFDL